MRTDFKPRVFSRLVKAPVPWVKIRPLLGVLTDSEIGRKFGIASPTIQNWRVRCGISVSPESKKAAAHPLPIYDSLMLGKMSDGEFARMNGVSTVAAGAARRQRGIPAHRPVLKCPCGFEFKQWQSNQFLHSRECRIDWKRAAIGKSIGEKYGTSEYRMLCFIVNRLSRHLRMARRG